MKQEIKVANSPKNDFGLAASNAPALTKAKQTAPFSLRLTTEERAYLNQMAGNRPLGGYIRERLLGENGDKRRSFRKPRTDEVQVARVLAELGRSRLASNLNQLAKSANIGTLDVNDDIESQLIEACAAVQSMRENLIAALGLKVEDGQ